MLITIFLILNTLGCVLLYMSNTNQSWIKQPLSILPWRYISYTLLIIGLVGWIWQLTTSAAIFSWLAVLMLILGTLPFANLLFLRVSRGQN